MIALKAGRSGGRKAQDQTCTCTERGRRLEWWMLWHHHCSETSMVLLLYTYRVRAQLQCHHKPCWWHYTGMAVHMEGDRMSPLPLLWSIQWTPLPRRDDMPVCFSFLLGMTHCSYLVISRNIHGWVGHYAGADNTTQNTELPPVLNSLMFFKNCSRKDCDHGKPSTCKALQEHQRTRTEILWFP